MIPTYAFAGAFAFALMLVLTPATKRMAVRIGAVAVPKADRWHRAVIPMMGGVPIVVATLFAALLSPIENPAIWILLGCATLLGLTGLVDDFRPLRPHTKMGLQILVAAAMTGFGFQLQLTGSLVLDMLLTLFWLVGITNALNLLDNMDGLAAGIAAIVAGFRLAFFLSDGNIEGAILASIVLGTCLGFLVFNFNPASIFMGDTGSLFLGFLTAGLSLVGGWPYSRGTVSVLIFPVLVVLVPIFDTGFVTIARILAGRRISQGGRDHTSHRLVALGLSERMAVLLLYGLAGLGGAIALLSYRIGLSYGVVLAVFLVLAVGLLGIFLGRLKVYEAASEVPPGLALRLVNRAAYPRQVFTIAIDMVLVIAAYYSAYLLRFEGDVAAQAQFFSKSVPLVVFCHVVAFMVARTYQGIWRYTGLPDLMRLGQAVLGGTALSALAVLLLYRFDGYSRAVFLIHAILLLMLIGLSRVSFRALEQLFRLHVRGGRPVVVYGAGQAGLMVLREVIENRDLDWRVVAFIDDARDKHRTRIHGIPVAGGLDALEEVLSTFAPDRVIVSSAKVPPQRVAELTERCRPFGSRVVRASIRFE